MLMTKNQLQDATDAAALAAASALVSDARPDIEEAKAIARKFLKTRRHGLRDGHAGQGTAGWHPPRLRRARDGGRSTTMGRHQHDGDQYRRDGERAKGMSFQVTVANKHRLQLNAMTRLLGQESVEIETQSTAQSATERQERPVHVSGCSTASGSMAWKTNTVNTAKAKCQNYTEANWSKYPDLKANQPLLRHQRSTP